jgi:hypothetical protein
MHLVLLNPDHHQHRSFWTHRHWIHLLIQRIDKRDLIIPAKRIASLAFDIVTIRSLAHTKIIIQ